MNLLTGTTGIISYSKSHRRAASCRIRDRQDRRSPFDNNKEMKREETADCGKQQNIINDAPRKRETEPKERHTLNELD